MTNDEERLLLLMKHLAYVPGTVTLSSGKTSDFYIDCRRVSLTHSGAKFIGKVLDHAIWECDPYGDVSVVAGEGVGGVAIAVATTMASEAIQNTLCIRKAEKTHGTSAGSAVEGSFGVKPGAEIVLLEDVVTSGNSVLRAAQVLTEAGYKIRKIIALVDRIEGGAEAIRDAGYSFKSIFTRHDFVGEDSKPLF